MTQKTCMVCYFYWTRKTAVPWHLTCRHRLAIFNRRLSGLLESTGPLFCQTRMAIVPTGRPIAVHELTTR